jgi:hypothetical protein
MEAMRDLLAPAAMISANGLICLALFNRLTAVINRLRMFSKERFDVQTTLLDDLANHERIHATDPLLRRLDNLKRQCRLITRRAHWLRDALACMLLGTMGMLASSLVLGLTHLWPVIESTGLGLFVAGMVCMLLGVSFALLELVTSLRSLEIESESFQHFPESASDALQELEANFASPPAKVRVAPRRTRPVVAVDCLVPPLPDLNASVATPISTP